MLIKCVGTRSNRSAIGARVKVTGGGRSQIDEVMSGSSYYSQNDLRLHFGLGRGGQGRQRRDGLALGREGNAARPAANQLFVIQETKGIVSRQKLG